MGAAGENEQIGIVNHATVDAMAVAHRKINDSDYTGTLFSLTRFAEYEPHTKSISFLRPRGAYTELFSYCKIS